MAIKKQGTVKTVEDRANELGRAKVAPVTSAERLKLGVKGETAAERAARESAYDPTLAECGVTVEGIKRAHEAMFGPEYEQARATTAAWINAIEGHDSATIAKKIQRALEQGIRVPAEAVKHLMLTVGTEKNREPAHGLGDIPGFNDALNNWERKIAAECPDRPGDVLVRVPLPEKPGEIRCLLDDLAQDVHELWIVAMALGGALDEILVQAPDDPQTQGLYGTQAPFTSLGARLSKEIQEVRSIRTYLSGIQGRIAL